MEDGAMLLKVKKGWLLKSRIQQILLVIYNFSPPRVGSGVQIHISGEILSMLGLAVKPKRGLHQSVLWKEKNDKINSIPEKKSQCFSYQTLA